MRDSKFLKQSDVGEAGILVTITGCEQQNVAMEGQRPELKWVLTLHESEKPLVLNATNIQLCERIFNSDNTDDWIGKRLVLYVDPNVSYEGKLIGGIRVRAVRPKPAPKPAPRPAPAPEPERADYDDDPDPGF